MVIGFDLDDTLYDRSRPLKYAFEKANFDVDFDRFRHLFKEYSEQAIRIHNKGFLDLEDSRIYRIVKTIHAFGNLLTYEEGEDFQKTYSDAQDKIFLYEGYEEVFKYLKSKDVEMFILTNGPTFHQKRKVERLGLKKYFDENNIFISDEIGYSKPDKRAFEIVDKKLNLKDKEVYFVGDSIENDLVGARNFGFNPIHFKTDCEISKEFETVNSVTELLTKIKSVF